MHTTIKREISSIFFVFSYLKYESVPQENAEIIKLLLKKGANKECQDDFGITPLFVAAQYGKLESLSVLISSGKTNPLAFALLRS